LEEITLDRDPGSGDKKGAIGKLGLKLDEIFLAMEKKGIAQQVEMLNHPWRQLRINFWFGLANGIGAAIGFTVVAALVVLGLQKIVASNMPLIGNSIAVIVKIVENQLHPGGNGF
jgi:hypothetical protein